MGASQSGLREGHRRCASPQQQQQQPIDKTSASVRRRIQLLEELCSQTEPGKKAEVLLQLGAGQNSDHLLANANVLTHRPHEFQPGELIAAGSYGRVYAGTYDGQPAALKLLLLDEETAHAILNEVRLCLKLNHCNLVQLLDCAVVAARPLPTADEQVSPGAAFAGQHHQILPVFGTSCSPATPSTSCAYSYLPIVSRQTVVGGAASADQHDNSTSTALLGSGIGGHDVAVPEPVHYESRPPALASSLGCGFEVWIAMELCDGGTLAQQLQMGFHCFAGSQQVDMESLLHVGLDIARALAYMHSENVCHGDLKTENVLLKSLSPGCAADMQRYCSTCGSCCSHDDCSWLGMLCSSSLTSNTCGSRCRSCSGDSCWTCHNRAGGCMEHSASSSSPDSLSTCSSNASGPNAERRGRPGFKGHLLSGLCCMGSPMSWATEDDAYNDEVAGTMPGCFVCGCGGCGVMTLEPSTVSGRYSPDEPPAEQPMQQPSGVVGQVTTTFAQQPITCDPSALEVLGSTVHTGSGAAAMLSASLSPAFSPIFLEQPMVEPSQLQLTGELNVSGGNGSYAIPEEVPEEEHVAPLSLYTQARQRRRSRCFPHGVMPGVLAAAAAAASADLSLGHVPAGSSCGSSSGGVSDDDDQGLASKRAIHSHSVDLQHAVLLEHSVEAAPGLTDLAPGQTDTAAAGADSASGCRGGSKGSSKDHQIDAVAGWMGWHEPAAATNQGNGAAVACHDVYAQSLLLPPVPHRARRHSFCYGTASSYGVSVLSSSRGLAGLGRMHSIPSGGVSATEAATAIAAAAEAVRHDAARSADHRSHRCRRMSWDDRLLRQQSPSRGPLGSCLGVALPVLGRVACDEASRGAAPGPWYSQPGAAAAAGAQHPKRTRRHSWAGYLQPDMFNVLAGSSHGWGLHLPTGLAAAQQQQQQREHLQHHNLDIMGAAAGTAARGEHSSSGPSATPHSVSRKARRHSWAGYGMEHGPAVPAGKPSGFRVLSSCFAATEPVDVQPSLQRHLFSLPPFPGCCGESCMQPLDDPAAEADSQQALLEGATSSSVLVDAHARGCLLLSSGAAADEAAAAVGCFGKWCPSCTNSSATSSIGSGQHRRRRRYSWCCGAGSEAELWADLARGYSCSQLGLLSVGSELSAPLMPEPTQQRKLRPRDRRCSWDGFRYNSRLQRNWGRKAESMHTQISTPDSWRSQQLSGASMSASRCSLLQHSSSDAAAPAEQKPLLAATWAAAPRMNSLPSTPPRAQLVDTGHCHGSCSDTQREGVVAEAVSPASRAPGCSSSLVDCQDCLTPIAPIKGSIPRSPVPADTRQDAQVDQSLSGPLCALPPPLLGVKTSRVRVSLDQPLLSLSPTSRPQLLPQQRQLQAVPGSSGGPYAVGLSMPDAAGGGCATRGKLASSGGQRQQQAADAVDVAGQGGVGDFATQCTSQGPLALSSCCASASQQQVGQGAAVTRQDDDACLQEPFTGSFTLHPSTSCAAADASSSAAKGSRGRRWSTGVAAHQLLLRQQLLDASSSGALAGLGLPAPTPSISVSAAGPVAELHASAVDGNQLPAAAAADCKGAAAPDFLLTTVGSNSIGSVSPQRVGITSSTGTNVPAACNVLGMPRKPMVVMSQRRMSYDTATGAYQLVAESGNQQMCGPTPAQLQLGDLDLPLEQQYLSASSWHQQDQQTKLQQGLGSQQPASRHSPVTVSVQDLQPTDEVCSSVSGVATTNAAQEIQQSHDEQMQQHCQAQMQRLLDALAKKGYGGLQDSGGACNSQEHPAGLVAAASDVAVGHATLQQQAQVAHDVAPPPPRRFCAKVCDFGFSKCLRAGQSHCSTASAGTITHQAPEVLRHGHLSPAADVYAFGIIMWELLTRDRPFRGLLEGDLVVGVCDRGLRPVFPPGCPASYVALAQQCWSDDPGLRPTAPQLVKRLNELLYEERRARLRASAGAVAATQNESCRRRRHSMPATGYGRQRRRSRRMSLFLLPFTRQPAVPEDAPLDQQVDDLCCPASGSHSCGNHAASVPASQTSSGADVQTSAVGGNSRSHSCRSRRLSLQGLSSSHNSSGQHAISTGHAVTNVASSGSNAVVSGGGLLAMSGRLRASTAASGPALACSSSTAVGQDEHKAAAARDDGTEWFQSF